MRVALDTNILFSAFVLSSHYLLQLIDALTERHTIVLSTYVIDELKRITKHKFPAQYDCLETFLYELPFELVYTPEKIDEAKYPHIRDPHDLPILASAILADADILLTGDNDFAVVEIKRPKVMRAREFLEKY
jgi:putative PIN family toxin of toxin-antitoxin system